MRATWSILNSPSKRHQPTTEFIAAIVMRAITRASTSSRSEPSRCPASIRRTQPFANSRSGTARFSLVASGDSSKQRIFALVKSESSVIAVTYATTAAVNRSWPEASSPAAFKAARIASLACSNPTARTSSTIASFESKW